MPRCAHLLTGDVCLITHCRLQPFSWRRGALLSSAVAVQEVDEDIVASCVSSKVEESIMQISPFLNNWPYI